MILIIKVKSNNNDTMIMKRNDTIHIIYAIDAVSLPVAIVSTASIIRNAKQPERLFFHYIFVNINWDHVPFMMDLQISLGNRSRFDSIHWHPLPTVISSMIVRKKDRQDLAAAANYARFYISKLYPTINHFIYLDNDVIAVQSIEPLWDVDLGDKVIGMVHDCGSFFIDHVIHNRNYNISHPFVQAIFGTKVLLFHDTKSRREQNISLKDKNNNNDDKSLCYPNPGVMLINQTLFNKMNILDTIEKLIELNRHEFIYQLGSQPLIVLTMWKKYYILDTKWNILLTSPLSSYKTINIIHYNGINMKRYMYYYITKFLMHGKYDLWAIDLNHYQMKWLHLAEKVFKSNVTQYITNVLLQSKIEYMRKFLNYNNTYNNQKILKYIKQMNGEVIHSKMIEDYSNYFNQKSKNNTMMMMMMSMIQRNCSYNLTANEKICYLHLYKNEMNQNYSNSSFIEQHWKEIGCKDNRNFTSNCEHHNLTDFEVRCYFYLNKNIYKLCLKHLHPLKCGMQHYRTHGFLENLSYQPCGWKEVDSIIIKPQQHNKLITLTVPSTEFTQSKNNENFNIRQDTIHIIYAMDNIMLPLTIISTASIIRNAKQPERLFFHYIFVNINWDHVPFMMDLQISLGNRSRFDSIHWHPLPTVISSMIVRKKDRQDLAAAANYARFYISKLYPTINHFIYLDNDVIAVQSIEPLWDVDLGDKVIGMVHDCGSFFIDHVMNSSNYNLNHSIVNSIFGHDIYNKTNNSLCHPNSGVMLINQTLFNKMNILDTIEKLIELNQHEFIYQLGSQPLIVLTTWKKYYILDTKWNFRLALHSLPLKSAHLIHFNGKTVKGFMFTYIAEHFTIKNRKIQKQIIYYDDRRLISSDSNVSDIGKISSYYNESYGDLSKSYSHDRHSRRRKLSNVNDGYKLLWITIANDLIFKLTDYVFNRLYSIATKYKKKYLIMGSFRCNYRLTVEDRICYKYNYFRFDNNNKYLGNISIDEHWKKYGCPEQRNIACSYHPLSMSESKCYLEKNKDIAINCNSSPLSHKIHVCVQEHWVKHGFYEDRKYSGCINMKGKKNNSFIT